MEKRFAHLSVMAEVAPPMVVTNPDGTYVDATFGRGGHSRRILSLLSPEGRLIAFDRDPQAIESAKEIDDKRFSIIHAPFSHMREELSLKNVDRVAGVFMDIGVSSPQIDDASRGFSFRMDGEERFAKKIARAIVQTRASSPLVSTQQLAKLVAQVVPANKKDPTQNPATRTFQAIRIHINSELDELSKALEAAMDLVDDGGRIAVITFHSLEDRIVKRFFDEKAHPERQFDSRLPLRVSELPAPELTDIRRILPSEEESALNPRARSAILRVATRVRTGRPA